MVTATKERPIIMGAESVGAILAGRKTQTRRLALLSPYTNVGDGLWVRETWQHYDWTDEGFPFVRYRADDALMVHCDIDERYVDRLNDTWESLSTTENYNIDNRAADRTWRSPIHMPRWASRITLAVTGVRAEQLNDITYADIVAEGYPDPNHPYHGRTWFMNHWNDLNAKRGFPWDFNPWVWVLDFEVAQ